MSSRPPVLIGAKPSEVQSSLLGNGLKGSLRAGCFDGSVTSCRQWVPEPFEGYWSWRGHLDSVLLSFLTQLTLQVCEYQSWRNGGGGTDLTCCETTSKIADVQPGKFPGPAHAEEPGTQNKSSLLMKYDCTGHEQFCFSSLTMPLAYLQKCISPNSFYL